MLNSHYINLFKFYLNKYTYKPNLTAQLQPDINYVITWIIIITSI
jgi:hypothetical protein